MVKERVLAFSGEEQLIVPSKSSGFVDDYANLVDSGIKRGEEPIVVPVFTSPSENPISVYQPITVNPNPPAPEPTLPPASPEDRPAPIDGKSTLPSLTLDTTGGLPVNPPKTFDTTPSSVPAPAAVVLATPSFSPVFGGGGGGFGAAPSGGAKESKKSNMGLWLILALGVGIYLLSKKS